MNDSIKNFKINKLFAEEDSRFLLSCGIKFSSIYLVISLIMIYVLWVILSINSIYFEAKGFLPSAELKTAFFDNAIQVLYHYGPYILGFYFLLFFIGTYIGRMLLRPFKIIGQYTEKRTLGESLEFTPDAFSDYKLLTRFADFFFRYLDDCIKQKEIVPNTIPSGFRKLHKPVFERVFFFHFMLFVGIILIISCSSIFFVTTEIQSEIIDLALKLFKSDSNATNYFLEQQRYIFNSLGYFLFGLTTLSYLLLSFHLYSKVSGAIFGFFTTMRSFMKGNQKARIHLLGYSHVRPHSRQFNKYLDLVVRECSPNNKNKVK